MNHYDVVFVGPSGNQGTHHCVVAETEEDAARLSPIMLSYGTPYDPDRDFRVLFVTPSQSQKVLQP